MQVSQKNIIIDAVISAGKNIKKHAGNQDASLFTKNSLFDYSIPADKEAEKIIIEGICKSNIDAKIISEESDIIGDSDAEYTVYLDPLDGSVNFSRGIPAFCIGVGIYKNNKPLLGIIYDISLDELFIAETGLGITLNGSKISPKRIKTNILVNLEWFGAPCYEEVVGKLKTHNIRARTSGSGVLALCYGSIGRGDATILIQNRPWDIAPGMVFMKESGYEIKQFDGTDVDFSISKQDVIAAPKDIFDQLFRTIHS